MSEAVPDLAALAAVAGFAPHLAQAFASLACDMALVLDRSGCITQVVHNATGSLVAVTRGWEGRALADTVTADTRHKVDGLLAELDDQGLARRREVNLPDPGGIVVPVAFTALRLGIGGPSLAVGQDLRTVAQMQQRFLRVQQELERGYGMALRAAVQKAQRHDGSSDPDDTRGWGLPGTAPPGADESPEQLDEASRAAFSAWLRAERLASDPTPPTPAPPPARRRRRR